MVQAPLWFIYCVSLHKVDKSGTGSGTGNSPALHKCTNKLLSGSLLPTSHQLSPIEKRGAPQQDRCTTVHKFHTTPGGISRARNF